MPIRLVAKTPEMKAKIAQHFSAGFAEAKRAKSRKGRQVCFFRPCGTWFDLTARFPALKRWAIFTTISSRIVD